MNYIKNKITNIVDMVRGTSKTIITKEAMIKNYDHVLSTLEKSDVVLTWAFHLQCYGVLNMNEVHEQMKQWKPLLISGIMTISSTNNFETTDPYGKKWYCLVVQRQDPDTGEILGDIDPHGLLILGFMVTGHIYCFRSKTNRKRVYRWLENQSRKFKKKN